ncbi:MAG: dTMP kinase [bacterium]
MPYLKTNELKGKLIAIEGTDGVGRSTQIDLLQEWLEVQGYGVVVTGWTRSNLMSRTIEMAKNGNMLDRMTFSLLYATDFADRLENQILPALRSGFVVIADRYIYTAFARDAARTPDMHWIKDVFGFAPIPDLVCYLRLDVESLIPRVIESGGMNYWESGMDLHLSDNIFDSFKKYQKILIEAYDKMAEEYKFEVLDARRDVREIQADLRARIESIIKGPKGNIVSLPPSGGKPVKFETGMKASSQEIESRLHLLETSWIRPSSEEREAAEAPRAPLAPEIASPPVDDRVIPFSFSASQDSEAPGESESKS